MNRSVLLLLAALWPAHPVFAESGRVFGQTLLSEDSDGAYQQHHLAGYRHALDPSRDPSYLSLAAGYRAIDDVAGNAHFQTLRLVGRQRTQNWTGELRLHPHRSNAWSPWLGGATAVLTPHADWRFELSADRELVDTVTAVANRNWVDSTALSADYRLHPEWTVVAAVSTQNFRDDNRRLGRTFKLIHSPLALPGLDLQARAKRADADFNGTGYFSPSRLEEWDLGAGYSRAAFGDHWVFGARLSYGTQRVATGPHEPLYGVELRARGNFTGSIGLESQIGCSSTGGLNAQAAGSGYRYCQTQLTLFGRFGS